jgi:hypothetical protein
MMGLPPKILGFTVMRPRSVSSITVIGLSVRSSEHFVRQDIVDSNRLVGHADEAQLGALRPIPLFFGEHPRIFPHASRSL